VGNYVGIVEKEISEGLCYSVGWGQDVLFAVNNKTTKQLTLMQVVYFNLP
jgi:hypothetical protein